MSEYHWLPFPSPTLGPGSDPRRKKALSEFLAGPENRLAETAAFLAIGGVPIFTETHSSTAEKKSSLPTLNLRSEKKNRSHTADTPFDWRLPPPLRPDGTAPAVIDYMPIKNLPGLSPIVFYGPSGCGKTQIAGGICREIRSRDPHAEGIFLNAGEFYRSLTEAINENRVEELRKLFTRCRVLVLDNLEELEDHPIGTAELIRLLRSAESSGTLIVITLPRHPDETASLPAALRSRLVGGFLIPVSFPRERSRALLLQRFADAFRVKLSPKAEEFILAEFPEPPGEFFGLFAQLYQLHEWDKTPPDPERIADYLEKRILRNPVTLDLIAKTAARVYMVKLGDLKSKSRSKTLVAARNMILYIARNSIKVTLQELGRYFDGRDHSTILHGIHSVAEKITEDDDLRRQHDLIIEEINKRAKKIKIDKE